MSRESAIMLTIIPRAEDVEGQPILRPLPAAQCRSVGPFVFFDHMLETTYVPGTGMDIRQHPHIGLSTLTYLFEGEIRHKDSLGSDQHVRPGEVSWMTAGRAIAHPKPCTPSARACMVCRSGWHRPHPMSRAKVITATTLPTHCRSVMAWAFVSA
jgi:redox-sensitive bicupin YhaK (pirin superfamily)